MSKLNIHNINFISQVKKIEHPKNHKELVKQTNLEIERGKLAYANAITDAKQELPTSNFNEEFERELADLGFGGRVVPISNEDKGTPEDYAILAKKLETEDSFNIAPRANEFDCGMVL